MKSADWIRLLLALLLAGANTVLPPLAGWGYVGAWMLGTFVATLVFLSEAGAFTACGSSRWPLCRPSW